MLKQLASLWGVWLAACGCAAKAPHVLVVVSDDQGYADVGWTGGVIPTPTLDAIAEDAIKLTQFYVHPVCTPTRAALLTGRVAGRTGMTGPILPGAPCSLDRAVPTIAHEFRDRGYRTIMSGKWHLGHHRKRDTPTGCGFDEFHGVLNCCASYFTKIFWSPAFGGPTDWRKNHDAVAPPPPEHASEAFASLLGQAVSEHMTGTNSTQPLMMMLTLTAPHSPLQPTAEQYERCAGVNTERRRLFCGLMASVDDAVKSVQETLVEHGIWDDTIVVFTNDNGGNVWEGGRNYPFRGGKQSAFEGGSRATGFVKLPPSMATGPAGAHFDGLAHVSDIMPTLLALADRELASTSNDTAAATPAEPSASPHWSAGEGYDLSKALIAAKRGGKQAHLQHAATSADSEDATFGALQDQAWSPRQDIMMAWDVPTNKTAYRFGRWKLLLGNRGESRRWGEPGVGDWIGENVSEYVMELLMHFQYWAFEDGSGVLDEMVREQGSLVQQIWAQLFLLVTTGQWPNLHASEGPALFDLSVDPYEDRNLAAERPEVVKMMRERVQRLEQSFADAPDCDWMDIDLKMEFEDVSWTDAESGQQRTARYHGPWVDDDDTEYEPHVLNANGGRIAISWTIVGVQMLVGALLLRALVRRCLSHRAAKSKTE